MTMAMITSTTRISMSVKPLLRIARHLEVTTAG
jgi:hypothetical protein